jgi:hypothetical protein
MLATMVKMIFLKHWLTACALFSDLIYMGFILLPMDPCHPMLMMIYNAVIFTQIATHSAVDNIADPYALYKKKTMSVRSLTRWIIAAVCSGFATDWVVRWLMPDALPAEFGALIQVGQACSVTVYIFMSTNSWSDDKNVFNNNNNNSMDNNNNGTIASGNGKEKTPKPEIMNDFSSITQIDNSIRYRNAVLTSISGIFSIILALFGSTYMFEHFNSDGLSRFLAVICIIAITGYPGLKFLMMLNRDSYKIQRELMRFIHLAMTDHEAVLSILINWSHTMNGRFLTTLIFVLSIKLVTGVSFAPLLITGLLVSIISVVIFLMVISRMGFFRALFSGNVVAVGLCALLVGVLIGRQSCGVKFAMPDLTPSS